WYSRSTFEHRIKTPTPLFGITCCKYSYLADFDPCVTQRFPLGDPEFSTGSPKVLHRVTQASLFQQRVEWEYSTFTAQNLRKYHTVGIFTPADRFSNVSYLFALATSKQKESWASLPLPDQ